MTIGSISHSSVHVFILGMVSYTVFNYFGCVYMHNYKGERERLCAGHACTPNTKHYMNISYPYLTKHYVKPQPLALSLPMKNEGP